MPSIFSIRSNIKSLRFLNVETMNFISEGEASTAACAAYWEIPEAALVIVHCICVQAFAIHVGAPMYPSLQPVIAKPLDTPLTVIT